MANSPELPDGDTVFNDNIDICDPTGFWDSEKSREPNAVISPGFLQCTKNYIPQGYLGLFHSDFAAQLKTACRSEIYSLDTNKNEREAFIYDYTSKKLVINYIAKSGNQQTIKVLGYVGPKGFSATSNIELGTFENPLFAKSIRSDSDKPTFFIYDNGKKRFYRVELCLDTIKVVEGPCINLLDWTPIQLDIVNPSTNFNLDWDSPKKLTKVLPTSKRNHPDESSFEENTRYIPLKNAPHMNRWPRNFLVLHQNGIIDCIDGDTLQFRNHAAKLPSLGFYENNASRPQDMAAFDAFGLYDPNERCLGTAVAALSRDNITMALDFYNAQGGLVQSNITKIYNRSKMTPEIASGYTVVVNARNGHLYLVVRYLLENLQPPLLRLLDMPAASWMEPDERYSTFFVHPNSLIGLMKFEYDRFGFWIQLVFLMLPSLAIGIWLGFKARQKAASLGYDQLSRDAWFITVLAFGIPAYITFKLLVPKERMVTCANCGNLRRVEFETCQSCKRDWQKTRDLTTAPDWSVRDTDLSMKAEDIKT
jgi:hypothetical protein